MPNIPNLKTLPPRRSGFSGSPIKKVSASAFHQFGDAVSRTKNGERSDKIYGSINAAIKNKRSPNIKPESNSPKSTINQAFKPVVK